MSRRAALRLVAVVAGLAIAATAVGCNSGTTTAQKRSVVARSSATGDADPARSLCEDALPGRELVSATSTTVGEIRQHRIGPGSQPAADAFAAHPDTEDGAWCWFVREPDESLPQGGTTAYGVGPGPASGAPEAVAFASIGKGSTGVRTSGPPIVP